MQKRGFTLIELLVVIAIIAILSVVVILTLNPAALMQQGRDANRVSDMSTLNSAISIYTASGGTSLGSSNVVYVSIPDPTATSTAGDQCQGLGLPALLSSTYTYQCPATSTVRNTNGQGWIPINFSNALTSSPISQLPIDPVDQSSSNLFYTYTTNGTQYQLTAHFESQKYIPMEAASGGSDPALYTVGNNLSLAPYVGGMVGWWPLNEGNGSTTIDKSGSGNNGTWNGSAIGAGGTYYTTGNNQTYAGDFDGSSDYIDAGNPTILNLASSNFSIAAWAYTTATSQSGVIAGKTTLSGPGANDYDMYLTTSHYNFRISPSAGVQTLTGPSVSSGQWVQIVGTRTVGSSFSIYINGSLSGSMADNGGSVSSTYNFRIGRASNNLWPFNGLIDDVRIYNRALSASEIAAMYAAGR